MSNPYHSPSAPVRDHNPVPASKTKWKVFFWVMLMLELLTLVSMLMEPQEPWFDRLAEVIIYGTILTGLFGFAFDKAILVARFWGWMIPVGLTFDGYSLYRIDWRELSSTALELYVGIAMIALLIMPLMFLQYWVLYQYCMKSEGIWKS